MDAKLAPKPRQNVCTCIGPVGPLLSQNWCSLKNALALPALSVFTEIYMKEKNVISSGRWSKSAKW